VKWFALVEMVRSFVAFEVNSGEVLKRFGEVQRLLVGSGADLKPVEPVNIHITLRFLGDVTLDMVERVFAEMQKVTFKPFTVKLNGLGAFPDVRYPRVVWAGINDGADELRNVFDQLEPRLRGLGFAADSHGFSPHLTIARVRSGRNKTELARLINENVGYEFGSVYADCLRLKRSVLTPKGPIYSTLKEVCPPK
jgi:2'-5' RNA ligase